MKNIYINNLERYVLQRSVRELEDVIESSKSNGNVRIKICQITRIETALKVKELSIKSLGKYALSDKSTPQEVNSINRKIEHTKQTISILENILRKCQN